MSRHMILALATLWVFGMGAAQPSCQTSEPPQLIDGICMDTHQKDGEGVDYPMADIVIKWSQNLPLQFGEFEFPIMAHKWHGKEWDQYGTVRTQFNQLRNAMDMILEIDLPKITQQNPQNQGNFLPNGTKIPLGANNESMFKLALNNPNKPPVDWIYFSLGRGGNLVIGTSFQVKAFDKLYEKIPIPLTLMPSLIYTDTEGNRTPVFATGIYGSAQKGNSGFGAFLDVSPVLKPIASEVCYGSRSSATGSPVKSLEAVKTDVNGQMIAE